MSETMMQMLLFGIFNIISFFLGAKIGQKVVKGEEIKIPVINPVSTVKEFNKQKEEEYISEKFRVIAENIDNYDGSGLGQKDIPR